MGLVFKWVREQGGVEEMERRAKLKSELIYSTIENSGGFYFTSVKAGYRSRMNVPFRIKNSELEPEFLKDAKNLKMIQLKGHR